VIACLGDQAYRLAMSNKLTLKQKNLIALMPEVEAGRMTQEEAMKQAGYAASTARQQQSVLEAVSKPS
jgi:hypothetical protein